MRSCVPRAVFAYAALYLATVSCSKLVITFGYRVLACSTYL